MIYPLLLAAIFILTGIAVWMALPAAFEFLGSFNARYGAMLYNSLRHARPDITLEQCVRAVFIAEGTFFAFGMLATRFNPFLALWGTGLGMFGIRAFCKYLLSRRLDRFDDQMLDVAMTFKNSLRAGLSLQQAMEVVVREYPAPAAEEFAIALREIKLGATVEESMGSIIKRLPNEDLDILTSSIEILRQSGGNMVETFAVLADTIKERKKVESKIKTLTAQGRIQAIILCCMPFAMFLIIYVINPEYVAPLLNTTLGWMMLTLVVTLVTLGWVIIKKIITIEV